jgi:hypothetical protein
MSKRAISFFSENLQWLARVAGSSDRSFDRAGLLAGSHTFFYGAIS